MIIFDIPNFIDNLESYINILFGLFASSVAAKIKDL